MKTEYVGMLYFIFFVALILVARFFLGEEVISDILNRYIVVWLLITYLVGQYSIRFPKAF